MDWNILTGDVADKKKPPKLSAIVKVESAEEETEDSVIKGLDVTCGDTTFIPVEVEDDDR